MGIVARFCRACGQPNEAGAEQCPGCRASLRIVLPGQSLSPDESGDPASFAYCGFWTRQLADALDGLILTPLSFGLLCLVVFNGHMDLFTLLQGGNPGSFLLYNVLTVLLLLLYYVGFEGSVWQATPGKYLLGYRHIRQDGQPITHEHALLRFGLSIGWLLLAGLLLDVIVWTSVAGAFGLVVYGSILTNPTRQTVLDRWTDTVIVRRSLLKPKPHLSPEQPGR
jgi:uncharacterized RDD family membrane protein YckC